MNVTEFGLFTSIWSSSSSDHLVELYTLTQVNLGVTIVLVSPGKYEWKWFVIVQVAHFSQLFLSPLPW